MTRNDRETVSVADLLAEGAARHPERMLLREATPSGRSLTWAEADAAVQRLAVGLVESGAVAGLRVALSLPGGVDLALAYLAASRAQVVAVPLDPALDADERARRVASTGARLVLAEAGVAPGPERADDAPRVARVADIAAAGEGSDRELPPVRDPESIAVLLHTGDAGGDPVAAMLSHRALLAGLDQAAALEPPMLRPDDVVLGILPMHHVYGLNAVLGSVLRAGASLVLAPGVDAAGAALAAAEHRASVLPLAPPLIERWVAEPLIDGRDLRELLSAARVVVSGSSTLDPDTAAAFTARTGLVVHQGYGLTEASPAVTSTLAPAEQRDPAQAPRPWSLGWPLPGVEVRLIDADERPALTGDVGEIELRGANLFSGYWPDGRDAPGDDGWWRTGDIGVLGEDGALQVVDRVEEAIRVSGFRVFPREVEAVLEGVEGVGEVAVIGAGDDEIVAYVVPAADAAAHDADALARRVHDVAAAQLAAWRRPARVEVVERLPHTITGKVRKGRLRILERRRADGLLE